MKHTSSAPLGAASGSIVIAGIVIGTIAPSALHAAESVAGDVLEEVVITAERRTESLQRVAIAATVVAGDDLESKGVTRLYDLQSVAPALTVTKAGLTENVNIRGIGIASGSPAVANGVATYVDGAFQPPIVTSNAYFDIANVEVLRGPQGTLVGSNSTGGAIFITSQNPSFDRLKGYGELAAGNYASTSAQGAVNLPASDTLAFRIAGNYAYHASLYESTGTVRTNAGSLNDKSGRLGMLWKPGAFQALTKVEMVDRNTGGYAYQPIPGTQYGAYKPSDPYALNYDSPTKNHERGLISTMELRYQFAGGTTLRSLSGYQDKNIHNLYDLDATTQATPALPQATSDQFVRERLWTEEVNLLSSTEGRGDWILGGYVQRNVIDVDIVQLSNLFPTDIRIHDYKTTTGWFGQYDFRFTPRLELQAGLRYSTYLVTQVGSVAIGRGIPIFPPGGLVVADLTSRHNDGRPTGKVALNYRPDDNDLVYAFIARGYKAGGANSAASEFEPETVWDAEAGWKATLADGHVRTQLGLYYNRYENFQFNVLNPLTTQNNVQNMPNATIYGAEAQIQAQLGGWRGDAGVAYVHSKLPGIGGYINVRLLPGGGTANLGPQCPPGQPSNPPTCFDYVPYTQTASSGPNVFSPEWTFNAGVEYRFRMGEALSLTPRVNIAYIGPEWASIAYSPITDYLPGYTLVSGQVTLAVGKDWQIQAYGTNVGDKTFVSGQFGNAEFYGERRQYGLRVRRSF